MLTVDYYSTRLLDYCAMLSCAFVSVPYRTLSYTKIVLRVCAVEFRERSRRQRSAGTVWYVQYNAIQAVWYSRKLHSLLYCIVRTTIVPSSTASSWQWSGVIQGYTHSWISHDSISHVSTSTCTYVCHFSTTSTTSNNFYGSYRTTVLYSEWTAITRLTMYK